MRSINKISSEIPSITMSVNSATELISIKESEDTFDILNKSNSNIPLYNRHTIVFHSERMDRHIPVFERLPFNMTFHKDVKRPFCSIDLNDIDTISRIKNTKQKCMKTRHSTKPVLPKSKINRHR